MTDIRSFGIKKGDVLYIRGNLAQIADPGETEGKLKDFFINALLESVGDEGTIVTAAYTRLYWPFQLTPDRVFTKSSKSYCGALPMLFLKHPDCIRSRHPSTSYVAIGSKAQYILGDHDENSTEFAPFEKLIALDAKIISFGCDAGHAGLPIFHFVEEKLGLHVRSLLKGWGRVYYYDKEDKKKIFKNKSGTGCGGRTYSFFEHYAKAGCLTVSSIGRAIGVEGRISDLYQIDYQLIKGDHGQVCCDNPNCIRCNLLVPQKKNVRLKFFLYRGWIILFVVLKQILKKEDWKTAINTQAYFKWYGNPMFEKEVEKIIRKYGPSKYERY